MYIYIYRLESSVSDERFPPEGRGASRPEGAACTAGRLMNIYIYIYMYICVYLFI